MSTYLQFIKRELAKPDKSLRLNCMIPFVLSYKCPLCLILVNCLLFHLKKIFSYFVLIGLFLLGFFYFIYKNDKLKREFNEYLYTTKFRPAQNSPKGLIKIDASLEERIDKEVEEVNGCMRRTASVSSSNSPRSRQSSFLNIKPSLTGHYQIDDELHMIIELIIRDYVDSWYKRHISDTEEFAQYVRWTIYNALRRLNHSLKTIDWEQFFLNFVAPNSLIQMRMFKRARENAHKTSKASLNLNLSSATTFRIQLQTLMNAVESYQASSELNLIEQFFDIEVDAEKDICRDTISTSSSDNELDFLREMSDLLCFYLLPTNTFNCPSVRCFIREILANILIKISIEKMSDPDYINQSILYLTQDQAPLTENFITAVNYSTSLEELNELRLKIDEEILKTRSNDKGGQNDYEIKLKLSSLQFVRRRVETNMSNLVKLYNSGTNAPTNSSPTSSAQSNLASNSLTDEETALMNQSLANLNFNTVLTNETIQHCFIEYMGKNNVQYLVSFYLNADMYRQYAIKELNRNSKESSKSDKLSTNETKEMLKEFAKGLIDSYLLSANNFANIDDDDLPVNVSNHLFYKFELTQTIERMENYNFIDETLLDELQAKIYLLMKQKYYPPFRTCAELQKCLIKNDLISKLNDPTSVLFQSNELISNPNIIHDSSLLIDEEFNDNFNSKEDVLDNVVYIDESDRFSQSSFDVCSTSSFDMNNPNDEHNFRLSAVISSCGRCNELKETYAIYIIDVTKEYTDKKFKTEYWQTYRRFNDFHDLHIMIKKKFPVLNQLVLPGKSFRSSLSEEFLEKRRVELNKYLQTMCNPDVIVNNAGILKLIMKFLENKKWQNKQTTFKRRVDSFLTPMISSVQNIQSSIKNAPDNVIGMVKGLSDNILMSSTTTTTTTADSTPPNQKKNLTLHKRTLTPTSSKDINVTIANLDEIPTNNVPIRVILLLIDEIFDLKEKNQWIRQSLMAIVKSFVKNFKGDSMNRKVKERIADFLSEEQIAHYLKNFRKRTWPKGYPAEHMGPRSKAEREITRILVKTNLLALVPDEMRTILGTETTRRGMFNVFELLQHKSINKRFIFVLMENFLVNLYQPLVSKSHYGMSPSSSTSSFLIAQNSLFNPVTQIIRLHLTKSARLKTVKVKKENANDASNTLSKSKESNAVLNDVLRKNRSSNSLNTSMTSPMNNSSTILNESSTTTSSTECTASPPPPPPTTTTLNLASNSTIPRSKSLLNNILC